jgi:hypothetical protein
MRFARFVCSLVTAAAFTAVIAVGCVDSVDPRDDETGTPGGNDENNDRRQYDPRCDLDGDGWYGPQCNGCDGDDNDPNIGKMPDCNETWNCPSHVCVPPIVPP